MTYGPIDLLALELRVLNSKARFYRSCLSLSKKDRPGG